ncbi:MAG: hypothetical protein ACMUJM_19155 [bacterium]
MSGLLFNERPEMGAAEDETAVTSGVAEEPPDPVDWRNVPHILVIEALKLRDRIFGISQDTARQLATRVHL